MTQDTRPFTVNGPERVAGGWLLDAADYLKAGEREAAVVAIRKALVILEAEPHAPDDGMWP